MSGKWDGFTEEDIKKFANKGTDEKDTNPSSTLVVPVRVAKLQSKPRQTKKNVFRGKISQSEAQLNSLNGENPITSNMSCMPDSTHSLLVVDTSSKTLNEEMDNTKDVPQIDSPNQVSVCLRIKEGKSYEVLGSEKISLENFQARQKLMEEQNRRRKELLSKALSDRKKQTHAEAQRLQHIQDELQKLDMLLSNDVSILRNQIEVASLEFNEAQKRYSKAEKEFLDAKLKMHGKLEQKELLTEHLCTIIEQNEMRKARKLSELMEKLELRVTIDVNEESQNLVSTSPPMENGVGESISSDSSEPTSKHELTTRPTEHKANETEHLHKIESELNIEAELSSALLSSAGP